MAEWRLALAEAQEPRCQACGHTDVDEVLDLGYQPLCNQLMTSTNAPLVYYPLTLFHCRRCTLVQLGYVIPTHLVFGKQFTYLTGATPSAVKHFADLAGRIVRRFGLTACDLVVDIGSNDGTFLQAFLRQGVQVLGVDGSPQPVAVARAAGVPTIPRFFARGIVGQIHQETPPGVALRVITAANVLAHTDRVNEFLDELIQLMDDSTVFVIQNHWLMSLIERAEFDTIYHEHLRYYTLKSLSSLLERHGLFLFDTEKTDYYGGSFIAYASRTKQPRSEQLRKMSALEEQTDLYESLSGIKSKMLANRAKILELLGQLRIEGKRVVGIGAPMKATTLLNYYGITSELVESVTEVNTLKFGMVVPGTRIPVIDERAVNFGDVDYALILAWNVGQDLMKKLRALGYRGRFIMPNPEIQVLT